MQKQFSFLENIRLDKTSQKLYDLKNNKIKKKTKQIKLSINKVKYISQY